MSRGRFVALLVAAALTQGCSVRPEQPLISDFFSASRLRDLTAVARISTVVFEPRERGIVTSFTIRRVSAVPGNDGGAVKDVEIDAPVKLPDGSTVDKILVVRLQRRSGTTAADSGGLYNGWIVTAVTDAPLPASSPRS
jgi:hypothetical protein